MNAIGSGYTLALPAKTVRSPILAEPSGKCVRQGRISALHTHARRPSGLVTRSWTTRPKYQPWLPSRKATSISPCLCVVSASCGFDLVQRVKHREQEHKICTKVHLKYINAMLRSRGVGNKFSLAPALQHNHELGKVLLCVPTMPHACQWEGNLCENLGCKFARAEPRRGLRP